MPNSQEDYARMDRERIRERVKAKDHVAVELTAIKCYEEGDYDGAFKYYTMAAKLGNMDAHYKVADLYHEGKGVGKDLKKRIYHLEEAAIGGSSHSKVSSCRN